MVKSTSTANLVRPRTTIQDSNQSLGFTTTVALDKQRQRNSRSIVILTLCGTCMFLFILCACLVTVLVLVGRSLSTNAALMTAGNHSYRTIHEQRATDNIYLLSIREFASKILPSSVLSERTTTTTTATAITTTESVPYEAILSDGSKNNYSSSESSSEANVADTTSSSTVRIMRTAQVSKIIEQLGWRLPNETRPTLYNLLLRPNFQTQTFAGNVSIYLDVVKPISFVAVHSKFLSVATVSLQHNGTNIEVANAFDYPEREYWVTEVAQPLSVGEYVLNLSFNGKLTDRIVGFYQSSYHDVKTNEKR